MRYTRSLLPRRLPVSRRGELFARLIAALPREKKRARASALTTFLKVTRHSTSGMQSGARLAILKASAPEQISF